MNISLFISGLLIVVSVFIVIMYLRLKTLIGSNSLYNQELQNQLTELNAKLALAERDKSYLLESNSRQENQLALNQQQINKQNEQEQLLFKDKLQLVNDCARLQSENHSLKQAYQNLEELLKNLQTNISKEFNQMKDQALLELQNKANVTLMNVGKNSVVDPLNQRFRELDEKILELKKETQDVSNKSASLSEQANNLAQALLRDSQKKGEFGEMILANILEFAGLKEKINYLEQQYISTLNPESKNLRPDFVIKLPDERGIVIDSKNIIGEYYRSLNEEENKSKAIHNAIKAAIKNLASKDYIDELARTTGLGIFDYMIMFIPNEGLFSLLVEEDSPGDKRGLIWGAFQQKIIIAGPSTILPLLAMIERMWQNYEIEEKTAQILKLSSSLVDQLRLSLERLTILGNSINRVAVNYDDVVKSFANGSASGAIGRLAQLSAYNREMVANQPLLGENLIKRFPEDS